MTELQDEGLVTDDPVVAAMFLGKTVGVDDTVFDADVWDDLREITEDSVRRFIGDDYEGPEILIPYPTVWAVIKPVEGEPFIREAEMSPGIGYTTMLRPFGPHYHKRVLNIITTWGELRELVRRCKEDV
jgi:hypothetical protein